MNRPGGSVYTVAQINSYIKNMFSQDYLLGRVCVRGEISNCKYHPSGHIYFTLKDEKAAISCIMFAGSARTLRFRLENGQKVVAAGGIGVYEKGGTYQLYASDIRPDGLGELYIRYEALKKELEEMGMFDAQYKQPLPSFVRTLGVVTASTGAAVRDIIQISRRRNPGIRILLFAAKVQGEGAAESIAEGIYAMAQQKPDVIIVGRGGGSIEDLWAFNEEIVARAVFECPIPIISAVGHETDTVITDFVADVRAPTPSAAAELAIADVRQILLRLGQTEERLTTQMEYRIDRLRRELQGLETQLRLAGPVSRTQRLKQTLQERSGRLRQAMERTLMLKNNRLSIYSERLQGLSPQEKLSSGYALVVKQPHEGALSGAEPGTKAQRIYKAAQAQAGDRLTIWFSDGFVKARAEEVIQNTKMTEKTGKTSSIEN